MTTPSKPSVLLVDDEAEVLTVLQELVQSLGYLTSTARTGVEGLAAVETDPPDAVMLDISMPGILDGVKTLEAIKAHRPDLPIIMVTANADEELARTTLREGAFDYVMKPVELARLRQVLAAAVALSGKLPPE
jgi:CheY-like chemotaxis protein